ncbi:MAG: XRE family transcriptional regulator [Pseudomonadota bacterium]
MASTPKPDLGANLKRLRSSRGWNLSRLADEAGLPQSTLSKVESGQMSLNYDKLLSVADALEVDVRDLFTTAQELSNALGTMARRVIDRHVNEQPGQDGHYAYRFLCTELKNRLILPMILEVSQAPDPIPMMKVVGERFAFVLDGPVEFHCEQYETVTLNTGDSLYIDAAMSHAFVAPDGATAKVLTTLASTDFDYLRIAREVAATGAADATDRFNEMKKSGTKKS